MPYRARRRRFTSTRRGRYRRAAPRRRFGMRRPTSRVFRRAAINAAETKYIDKDVTALAGGNSAATRSFEGDSHVYPDPTVGSAFDQRVGREVFAKGMQLRIVCIPPAAANIPNGCVIRFWVVKERDVAGTTWDISDIWSNDGASTPAHGVNALRNRNHLDNDKILSTFTMSMSPGMLCPCVVEKYVALNTMVKFRADSTTSSYSTCEKNAINIFFAVEPAVDDDNFFLQMNCRTTYKDP